MQEEQQNCTDVLKRHRLDIDAVENGKWVDIKGDKWRVARLGCAAQAKERALALAEIGQPPDGDAPAHKSEWIQRWIFSRAIMRECKLQDAPDVCYTPDLGAQIYDDPELRELRDQLLREAGSDYTQDAIAKAAVLGN